MGKPQSTGGTASETYSSPEEGSPVDVFVSDTAWTVIRTGWNEVVWVDQQGKDRGKVGLIEKAFTREENERYVHNTTAGPKWAGYSLWYFLEVENRPWFVIRPWWGRRIIIDLKSGNLSPSIPPITKAIDEYEHRYVLAVLAEGIKTRKTWESPDYCPPVCPPVLMAAYLAGQLHLADVVPELRKLEDSTYIGSCTNGGLSALESFDGEVDPHTYATFTLRQVIQLSLRRLGEPPQDVPVFEFYLRYKDSDKDTEYRPKPLAVPRHTNPGEIKKGMKAEEVLALIGTPDFIDYDTWEYEMDTKPAYTFILKWDARHVIGIDKHVPALWQEGFTRDAKIAN